MFSIFQMTFSAAFPWQETSVFWLKFHSSLFHDSVSIWRHFPHYWHFMKGIYWSPVDFLLKGTAMPSFDISLMIALTNCLTNTEVKWLVIWDDIHMTYCNANSWWRHQMETFSTLFALCAGKSLVPVNSPHKGQWRGALIFSLICVWINHWVNNREAGDLRQHRDHYDVTVMWWYVIVGLCNALHLKFVPRGPIDDMIIISGSI